MNKIGLGILGSLGILPAPIYAQNEMRPHTLVWLVVEQPFDDAGSPMQCTRRFQKLDLQLITLAWQIVRKQSKLRISVPLKNRFVFRSAWQAREETPANRSWLQSEC